MAKDYNALTLPAIYAVYAVYGIWGIAVSFVDSFVLTWMFGFNDFIIGKEQ